ncbi:MAG: Zn-dependent hydrolase [delta proteobacterium MLS_D]|jgi:hydroxyacylglutathione hydrolase|nr:MAG: Zn-dependent hydrolase [delta proteobacterium MLS_D]
MEIAPNLHAFPWTSSTVNNCNTYLIRSAERTILIDPGHVSCFQHVVDGLDRIGLGPGDIDLVIGTHAHPDHVEAVSLFPDGTTRFALHENDWNMVRELFPLLGGTASLKLERFTPDFFLRDGTLRVGDILLEVYHTPGHSPGSVTIRWPDRSALFTGDLIFRGGLGRTDIPGGDSDTLKDSIRRVARLRGELLLSGHGDILTGEDAVKRNFEQVERMWFAYL